MSGVVVLAPIIGGAAWPLVTSAAVMVMAAMGYAVVQSAAKTDVDPDTKVDEEIEIELTNQEEVGQSVGRGQELVFEKDDVTVKFSRDIRGRMKVCVSGESHSKAELEELGHDLAGRVIQQYTYTRLMNEMKDRNDISIVEQTVDDDNTIHIKLRSWED